MSLDERLQIVLGGLVLRSAKLKLADPANGWPPMGLILLPEPGKIIFREAFRATRVFRGHTALLPARIRLSRGYRPDPLTARSMPIIWSASNTARASDAAQQKEKGTDVESRRLRVE
jgi:hypothetical protein